MLCDLKIQFEKAMNDGKYHMAEPHVTAISALNNTEGLYRYAFCTLFEQSVHVMDACVCVQESPVTESVESDIGGL